MRIDHHAYQRATWVAGYGLLFQLLIAVTLLVFGNVAGDAPSILASLFMLPGLLVWLGLIIIFHQHKLERLEALEEDELTASRAAAGSFFERAADETRVAARRLAMMHKWLMPTASIVIALLLIGLAIVIWRYMAGLDAAGSTREFHLTAERGWAIGICLFFAGLAFIFSRFIAGMAKQPVWHNLRGGAAYMVGNALILLAVSVGIIFRFFDNSRVIEVICYAIPVVMWVMAGEIVLNFILNLYRPRVPGDVPRPAFDSKLLSLFATPDSIVRSLNEAVNYQFGFDITSSWGYQLLLRSFISLVVLGVAALLLLSTMVIVEPHQQAVRLRGGAIVTHAAGNQRVYGSGVMWKWPWPIESAEIHDVSRMRSIHLTARVVAQQELPPDQRVISWDSPDPPRTENNIPFEPFIVGSPAVVADKVRVVESAVDLGAEEPSAQQADERAVAEVSDFYSLVDAEITIQYRIRSDVNGLLDYLKFAPETVNRRQTLSDRERALRNLALKEVSRHFSRVSLDDVLSLGRTRLTEDLRGRIQAAFDQHQTGVELVSVNLPLLRPSGNSAPSFEEINISAQARLQRIAQAKRNAFRMATETLGNAAIIEEGLGAIEEYERLAAEHGVDSTHAIEQKQKVRDLLSKSGGWTARQLSQAESDRWATLAGRRAQASRVQSQLVLYRAAPELYRHRELMKVYMALLPRIDKYIIAIDPANVSVNADLTKVNPIHEFAGASEEELQKSNP